MSVFGPAGHSRSRRFTRSANIGEISSGLVPLIHVGSSSGVPGCFSVNCNGSLVIICNGGRVEKDCLRELLATSNLLRSSYQDYQVTQPDPPANLKESIPSITLDPVLAPSCPVLISNTPPR
jgi:hypothetical protein